MTSAVAMTTRALIDLCPRLPQISEALNLIRELLQQLTNQRASIEEDVHSNFEDLHKQLDVRKSVLLMELEVTHGLKQKVPRSPPASHNHGAAAVKPAAPLHLLQVLQAQVDHLVQAEGDMVSSCSRSEEALGGEACVASVPGERQLRDRLLHLAQLSVSCQPEENDQLDLVMETDTLRKSIHNLGTIVTTRYAGQPRPQRTGASPEPLCSSPSVQWRARARPWGRGLKSAGWGIPPR